MEQVASPTEASAKYPFTIHDRLLVKRGSEPGKLATLHLEEVRDYLVALNMLQSPKDYDRTLNQLHVSFNRGHMEATWLTPEGPAASAFLVTDVGAQQLSSEVLPTRFFSGLKQLAKMDDAGSKVATLAWAKFASLHGDVPRKVRTINVKVNNEVRRAVRSCHSLNYAPYSNLEFVQDILNNAGRFAELPVISWQVSDTGMRLRFAGVKGEEIQLKKPVPMIEAWNSEVGLRRVVLQGGLWRLICTNGMGSWQEKTQYHWIHRGDGARIRKGVGDAFENLLTTANGVVETYNRALDVNIDNAFRWLEDQLNGYKVAQHVVEGAVKALNHPSTTPGGKLASVVDAITLIAQDESSLIEQWELERIAAHVLAEGHAIALRHGRIPLDA